MPSEIITLQLGQCGNQSKRTRGKLTGNSDHLPTRSSCSVIHQKNNIYRWWQNMHVAVSVKNSSLPRWNSSGTINNSWLSRERDSRQRERQKTRSFWPLLGRSNLTDWLTLHTRCLSHTYVHVDMQLPSISSRNGVLETAVCWAWDQSRRQIGTFRARRVRSERCLFLPGLIDTYEKVNLLSVSSL